MGYSKPCLEWHGSTLVRRVAGIVARAVGGPVVLVRSPGQPLPSLPEVFEVLEDLEEGRGPLGGLSVGLEALASRAEIAYVSSTDMPFLHPAFVHRVVNGLGARDQACVPYVRGFRQPLAAAYRVELAHTVQELLSSNRLRVSSLLSACRWKELDESALLADPDLARFDPGLESVTNLNDMHAYHKAAMRPSPTVRIRRLGEGSRVGAPELVTVCAATLAAAAAAIGERFGADLVAVLNRGRTSQDSEEPLVEGDEVILLRAESGP